MKYIKEYLEYSFITYRKHNQYGKNNMVKYIKIDNNPKLFFTTCHNFKNNLDKDWDLLVILFKDTNTIRQQIEKKFNKLIPLYPIFSDEYLIISKLIALQIYEMGNSCSPKDIAKLYLYEMGGILKEPKSKFPLEFNYKGIKIPKLQEIQSDISKYIYPNNHGWLSTNTRLTLRYVLKNIFNKKKVVIVELGSWLGSSTCEMLESMNNGVIYCFDHFQNIALSDYKFEKPHPLDEFWLSLPRYETFCKNISPYLSKNKKVYSVKYDVQKSINILRYYFISPNIVFIDAIKSTEKLINYLENLFKQVPNVIVIGDDYVFDSVKKAVSSFIKKYSNYWCYTNADCYILAKSSSIQSYGIQSNNELSNNANKFIKEEIKKDKYEEIVNLLLYKKYNEIFQFIKDNNIDINKPIEHYNNNTFYTLVIIEIYSKKDKDAIILRDFILKNIDNSPKKIKNSLHLTYQDYINKYISF
jgi:hypothetical protein